MTSTYTSSNRLDKPAQGDYYNTWATWWASTANMIDEATDGYVAVTVNSTKTLSTANSATDEARNRVLGCTGTGGTLTIPAVEKAYLIVNGCSANLTITCGVGATATVLQGQSAWVYCTSAATYNAGHLANQTPQLLSTTNITATASISVALPSGYNHFRAVIAGMIQSSGGPVNVNLGADISGTGFTPVAVALTSGSTYNGYTELWFYSDSATFEVGLATGSIATTTRSTVTTRVFNNMTFNLASSAYGASGTIKLYGIL